MHATTCGQCGLKNRIPAGHLADTGKCGSCGAPFGPTAEPIEVDTETFDEVIRTARVPVLVDFWAAWCMPCRMAAKEVKQTATAVAGKGLVLKVDTERHPELAARYRVQGIPNFVVFAGGRVVSQQAGLVDHHQMVGWIEQARAKA